MTIAAPTINGSVRLIVVGDLDELTRGRPSEFRHRGLTLVERPTVASALIEVGKEPDALVLVPTDLNDMPLTDFIDVLRSLAHVSVIAGLSSNSSPQFVSELFDHGVASAVLLPATPARLIEAVQVCRAPRVAGDMRLELGSIDLDEARYRATWRGRELSLTPQSFALLRYMLVSHPRVLTVRDVVGELGGEGTITPDRARSAITRLRRAFIDAAPQWGSPIVTVHRVGYRLEPGPGPEQLRIEEDINA